MGWGQSKTEEHETNNIAIAQVQTISNQMESKLNYVGIGLIVLGALLVILLCYAVRTKCRNYARTWVRKTVADLPPTSIRVQNTQAHPEQQAVY